MPTGYTDAIAEEISFKEFVMRCSRNFGATITMRDEPLDAPIPEEFIPSGFHDKELKVAKCKLKEVKRMTICDMQKEAKKQYQQQKEEYLQYIGKAVLLRQKYETMFGKVLAWTPPSEDHRPLKQFMIDQIRRSVECDCHEDYWLEQIQKLSHLEACEWQREAIAKAKEDIAYHSKERLAEVRRVRERNRWIKQLRENLQEIQEERK